MQFPEMPAVALLELRLRRPALQSLTEDKFVPPAYVPECITGLYCNNENHTCIVCSYVSHVAWTRGIAILPQGIGVGGRCDSPEPGWQCNLKSSKVPLNYVGIARGHTWHSLFQLLAENGDGEWGSK